MSFLEADQDNRYLSPESVATGPKIGPLRGAQYAFEAQDRAMSSRGVNEYLYDEVGTQREKLVKLGEVAPDWPILKPPTLMDATSFRPFEDVARFYTDGGTEEEANALRQYDERIEALRQKYPDAQLRTTYELWQSVRGAARDAVDRDAAARKGVTGTVGSFAGAIASGVNPVTNPMLAATLPIGGFGRTAAMRIATEAGSQGAIELANQLTGAQENMRLLGLETGAAQIASQVGLAAAGGAAIRGVGEGAVALGNRWFRNTPDDPAPPVPPRPEPTVSRRPMTKAEQDLADVMSGKRSFDEVYARQEGSPVGPTRHDARGMAEDLSHLEARLQAWDGDAPMAVRAPTPEEILARSEPSINYAAMTPDARAALGRASPDDLARTIDPDVFRVYDKLGAEMEQVRQYIEMAKPNDASRALAVQDIEVKIAEVETRLRAITPRDPAKLKRTLEAERKSLVEERDRVAHAHDTADSPTIKAYRDELARLDYKRRDLAPAVSRAYARARKKWAAGDADLRAVQDMLRRGESKLPDQAPGMLDAFDAFERTAADDIPALRQSASVRDRLPENAGVADIASAVMKHNDEVLTDGLQSFRDSLPKVLADQTDAIVPGTDIRLPLETKMMVPNEDGVGMREMSLRQMLQEQIDADEDLKAVTTCRI